MSSITVVPITSSDPVSVTVTAPKFPQNIGGVIWRYNSDKTFDVKAGLFTTIASEIPLGAPGLIDEKFYLIEGGVLHNNDEPPSPYQVVVTITQNGNIIHQQVPPDNGFGKIGKNDIPFLYRFQIKIQ